MSQLLLHLFFNFLLSLLCARLLINLHLGLSFSQTSEISLDQEAIRSQFLGSIADISPYSACQVALAGHFFLQLF
jgi:hypothetical protein